MRRVLVLHGPNLNLLGQREPDVYGAMSLNEINQKLIAKGQEWGLEVNCYQSNHEGELIDQIQGVLEGGFDGVIINPAAYTHTSVAIADALKMLTCPIIEVHLSNVYQREAFRHHSYIAPVATGQITGLGWVGYLLALDALNRLNVV